MAIKSTTKKVYFDTNVLIYLIENNPIYWDKIVALIAELDALNCEVVTSELTLAECLVKPFAENDKQSQGVYTASIKSSDFLTVKPVTKKILIEAARLRAVFKNKLPDSIHLATAFATGCDTFVGNDKKIKADDSIRLLILDSYDIE